MLNYPKNRVAIVSQNCNNSWYDKLMESYNRIVPIDRKTMKLNPYMPHEKRSHGNPALQRRAVFFPTGVEDARQRFRAAQEGGRGAVGDFLCTPSKVKGHLPKSKRTEWGPQEFNYLTKAGWWFGTFFIFPYIGNNHSNWLIFFRGVQTTNQKVAERITELWELFGRYHCSFSWVSMGDHGPFFLITGGTRL